MLLNLIKVSIIKGSSQRLWILVVKYASSIKLIVYPLALISKLVRLIVKFAKSHHPSFYPVTFIHSSVLVVKPSKTMLYAFVFVPFIATALDVKLSDVLSLLVWYR